MGKTEEKTKKNCFLIIVAPILIFCFLLNCKLFNYGSLKLNV